MKFLVNTARVLVGILFIFSGLVKANDPIGLSYKVQEFFLVWRMSALDNITLLLSLFIIAFEIIAGAALLSGWKIKTIRWLLLLLIVFFTFLTGYAYLSGKFKNCGCFGDCIPITAQTSFIKDLVLLVLILLIFFNQKYIKPILPPALLLLVMLLVTVFSFAAQWYTLKYLPVADCLPFKRGGNIPRLMQVPANAIPDSTIITFQYEKNGKKVEFTAENFPEDFNDSTYKFISRYDKLIRPGVNNLPPITAFALTMPDGTDLTQSILQSSYALILFMENVSTPINKWSADFEQLNKLADEKNIPVYIVTSTNSAVKKQITSTAFRSVVVLNGDNTMIRIAARTNPTLYLLKQGTIEEKWSYKNFDAANAILKSISPVAAAKSNPATNSIKNDSLINHPRP